MIQSSEPVFIQAFIPKLPIEAFYERILGRFAWLDQLQLHPMLIGPLIQCLTGELWPFVNIPVLVARGYLH